MQNITTKNTKTNDKIRSKIGAFIGKIDNWQYSYLAWCLVLPMVIMLFLFIAMKMHPFGEESVLVLDLNGQYVHFFEALRDWVWGEGSLLYSFGRSLGGEFMGIYAYYLASPLSYIVALFPKSMILEALMIMFIIKCGLCGLSFGFYLHKSGRSTKNATIIFSVMYALMMYCIAYQHNTMWIDNVILLPLVALGVENIIRNKKFTLFTVSLALSLLSSYYIGYMTCLFVAIYFFYFYFAHDASERNNPLKEKNHFLKSFVRIVFYSIIGVGISAIIVLSAYYSLTFGKSTFTSPDFSFTQNFDVVDFIAKLFPSTYDTVYVTGLPFVYCGVLALVLLPIYFLAKSIPWQEKVATAFILLIFLASMGINTLDMIWHGFQAPNWLNYRYSFMFCFLLLMIASRALSHIREVGTKAVACVSCALMLILIIIQKLDISNLRNHEVETFFVDDIKTVWLGLFCIAIYAIILMTIMRRRTPRFVATILLVVVCGEVFISGLSSFKELDEDVYISTYDSYHSFYNRYQSTIDQIKAEDTDFYRMEKIERRNTNDAMALGYRGVSNSTSTLNRDTLAFLRNIGLYSTSHYSRYVGSTPVTDAFLGVKYVIGEDAEDIPDLYEYYSGTEEISAYKNPYALPIAFMSSNEIKNVSYTDISSLTGEEYGTPFSKMNATISAMLGKRNFNVYDLINECTITTTGETKAPYSIAEHTHYNASAITFTTTAPKDGTVYFFLPTEYGRLATITAANGSTLAEYGVTNSEIVNVGDFKAGDTVTVTVKLTSSNYYLMENEAYFAMLNEENFVSAMTTLQGFGITLTDYTERSFKGTVNAVAGKTVVFTTIPYDSGWKVKVDGKGVTTYETLDALLAFDVPTGEHDVSIVYMPDTFVSGAIITVSSVVILSLLIVLAYLFKIKKLTQSGRIGAIANVFLPMPQDANTFTEDAYRAPQGELCAYFPPEENSEETIETQETQQNPQN